MDNATSRIARIMAPAGYVVVAALFILTFFPAIRLLVGAWYRSEDYSYGFFIVPISLYLIYHKRDALMKTRIESGRFGIALFTFTIGLYLFAHLAQIATLRSLGLVFTLWAILWTVFGKPVFKQILFPMILLLFMVPVPSQFYSMATIPLQLFVSKVSVWGVELINVPILREGNILHMPGRTLAVVQACSGLRSLMSLFFLCVVYGYISFRSNIFRAVLAVISIPTAVFVNIVRVVTIILAFHYFDADLSAGTVHTVLGVFIFILALLIVAVVRSLIFKWDLKFQVE